MASSENVEKVVNYIQSRIEQSVKSRLRPRFKSTDSSRYESQPRHQRPKASGARNLSYYRLLNDYSTASALRMMPVDLESAIKITPRVRLGKKANDLRKSSTLIRVSKPLTQNNFSGYSELSDTHKRIKIDESLKEVIPAMEENSTKKKRHVKESNHMNTEPVRRDKTKNRKSNTEFSSVHAISSLPKLCYDQIKPIIEPQNSHDSSLSPSNYQAVRDYLKPDSYLESIQNNTIRYIPVCLSIEDKNGKAVLRPLTDYEQQELLRLIDQNEVNLTLSKSPSTKITMTALDDGTKYEAYKEADANCSNSNNIKLYPNYLVSDDFGGAGASISLEKDQDYYAQFMTPEKQKKNYSAGNESSKELVHADPKYSEHSLDLSESLENDPDSHSNTKVTKSDFYNLTRDPHLKSAQIGCENEGSRDIQNVGNLPEYPSRHEKKIAKVVERYEQPPSSPPSTSKSGSYHATRFILEETASQLLQLEVLPVTGNKEDSVLKSQNIKPVDKHLLKSTKIDDEKNQSMTTDSVLLPELRTLGSTVNSDKRDPMIPSDSVDTYLTSVNSQDSLLKSVDGMQLEFKEFFKRDDLLVTKTSTATAFSNVPANNTFKELELTDSEETIREIISKTPEEAIKKRLSTDRSSFSRVVDTRDGVAEITKEMTSKNGHIIIEETGKERLSVSLRNSPSSKNETFTQFSRSELTPKIDKSLDGKPYIQDFNSDLGQVMESREKEKSVVFNGTEPIYAKLKDTNSSLRKQYKEELTATVLDSRLPSSPPSSSRKQGFFLISGQIALKKDDNKSPSFTSRYDEMSNGPSLLHERELNVRATPSLPAVINKEKITEDKPNTKAISVGAKLEYEKLDPISMISEAKMILMAPRAESQSLTGRLFLVQNILSQID